MSLESISPDGRYLLLVRRLADHKGDLTAVPYLWDRTTGELTEGARTSVRFARWSGKGFYIDWLTHLDLALQETHLDELARLFGLKKDEREIIASSFSADGAHVAALVGHPTKGGPLDLIQARVDGTDLTLVPNATTGEATPLGTVARVSLAPSGQFLAISGKGGAFIARSNDLDPKRRVPLRAGGTEILWAPDSSHVWFPDGGIFDLHGQSVLNLGQNYGLVWQPDGQGGVVFGYSYIRSFRLDGAVSEVPIPDYLIPAGYLPDGRLLVWRTVTE